MRSAENGWGATVADDMAIFARTVRHVAGEELDDRIAVAHAIRNRVGVVRALIRRGRRVPRRFGDGTLAGSCLVFDPSPGLPPPEDFDDPGYCHDMALVCAVWRLALPDPTGGATCFHDHRCEPPWARNRAPVALIGEHLFYTIPH